MRESWLGLALLVAMAGDLTVARLDAHASTPDPQPTGQLGTSRQPLPRLLPALLASRDPLFPADERWSGASILPNPLLSEKVLSRHPATDRAMADDPPPVELADRSLWVTNGEVRSLLLHDDRLYVGGNFNVVGPLTGGGGCVDARTGAIRQTPLDILYSRSYGGVFAVIPDGTGGWFVGGAFTSIQGRPFAHLARIGADGSPLDWHADTNGEIRSIARDGPTLYVAGAFTSVGGVERRGVAALDAATGAVQDWDPRANALAISIVPADGKVFVGGYFDSIGGAARSCIAALDPVTGSALDWNPSAVLHQPSWKPVVESLINGGSCLYVGGAFDSIGGARRRNIAALDMLTGLATSWDPDAGHSDSPYPGVVLALALGEGVVYAGGYFDSIGGHARNHLAALDRNTAVATPWDPDTGPYNPRYWYYGVPGVFTLAASDSMVYVGGGFTQIGGIARFGVAALDPATAAVRAWNPHPASYDFNPRRSNAVFALALDGDRVFVGGDFITIGGCERHNLAALDIGTGAATAWAPDPDSTVLTMMPLGTSLYIGGAFRQLGGVQRLRAAAVDLHSGLPTPWAPLANGDVLALAGDETRIYVGGLFTQINGSGARWLVAVDPQSGHLQLWGGNVDGGVKSIVLDGRTVYVGGYLVSVSGVERRGIVALDATSGAVRPWDARLTNSRSPYSPFVNTMLLSNDQLYLGGEFSHARGQPRWHVAAVDTLAGEPSSWPVDFGGTVSAVTLIGSTACVAGNFGVAAIDSTGAITGWHAGGYDPVWALATKDSTLYVGGEFATIAGGIRPNLAALTTTHLNTPAPPVLPPITNGFQLAVPSPVRGMTLIRFQLPFFRRTGLRVLDVQGRHVATLLDHIWQGPGWHEISLSTAGWRPGVYFCRLDHGGFVASQKIVVLR